MRQRRETEAACKPYRIAFSGRIPSQLSAPEKNRDRSEAACSELTDGFGRPVYCVNPQYERFLAKPCYASVLDLPQSVSHAVIAVNRNRVMDCIRQCAQTAVRHVIVISAGFKETDAVGAALEEEMAAFCREHEIVLLGPNTLA